MQTRIYRMSILNLERCWPTRDCWFRLMTTLTGMCVVDFHRLYKNIKSEGTSDANKAKVDALEIGRFSDMLCRSLRKRSKRAAATLGQFSAAQGVAPQLARITDKDGNKTREVTEKQRWNAKSVGTSRQLKCFMCRKYLNANGSTRYQDTSFWCTECNMPLCKQDRTDTMRESTCLDEHLNSTDSVLGCTNKCQKATAFPKDKQVNLHPRRGGRRAGL
jgi:hypothetical protein